MRPLAAGADTAPEPAADIVGQWFDLHVDALYGYAARRLGEQPALDVVGETFRIALEHFDDFDPQRGEPRAWLYGIATNLIRRHWRTEARRLRTHAAAASRAAAHGADPSADVDGSLDDRRSYARIAAAFGALAQQDRDLLVLTAWEGMTSIQAATVLGIPAGTVRSRLHRIRTQLRHEGMADHG